MTFMSCSAAVSDGIAPRFLICGCARGVLALGSHRIGRRARRRHAAAVFALRRRRRRRPSEWQRPWWRTFFADWNEDEESLAGLREDDELLEAIGADQELSENEKFDEWRRKAEAIVELREAQQDAINAEARSWEDWTSGASGGGGGNGASPGNGGGNGDWGGEANVLDEITDDPAEIVWDKGVIEAFKDTVDDDYEDMLFEDRVFMYASTNSAKFLAVLIVVPWVIDFAVHHYVMMPFLERYVQKVPLAAELLDVRRSQKLHMVKDLNMEKARYRLEVEIGKSPPLSDEEVWEEMREKALELRDDWRLENREAFANIWSDMVYGIVLFLLLCFNQSRVAMLKFTGYKLLNNISDTGKAFLIILISDILLGYHSESGWHTMVEVVLEHYGLESDEAAVTFFVCLVPVALDVYIKFWVYKYLPRLSPSVGNVLDEIKRH